MTRDDIIKAKLLEMKTLSKEILQKSFDLCYVEEDEISTNGKIINRESHDLLVLIEQAESLFKKEG